MSKCVEQFSDLREPWCYRVGNKRITGMKVQLASLDGTSIISTTYYAPDGTVIDINEVDHVECIDCFKPQPVYVCNANDISGGEAQPPTVLDCNISDNMSDSDGDIVDNLDGTSTFTPKDLLAGRCLMIELMECGKATVVTNVGTFVVINSRELCFNCPVTILSITTITDLIKQIHVTSHN